MSRSEIMKRYWQDPEFRERVLKAQKKSLDERMRKRFLEIQKEAA